MDEQVEKALVLAKNALMLEKNPAGVYEHKPMEVDCIISVLKGEALRAVKLEAENKELKAELEQIKSTLKKLSA